MLIRKKHGREFHIVCGEAENTRYFKCLCGEKVEKNCVSKQTVASGAYIRCYACRKIENERLLEARARAYADELKRRHAEWGHSPAPAR